jgi:hypothetical protein
VFQDFNALCALVSALPPADALIAARAFHEFLSLANLSESHHRLRRLRTSKTTPPASASASAASAAASASATTEALQYAAPPAVVKAAKAAEAMWSGGGGGGNAKAQDSKKEAAAGASAPSAGARLSPFSPLTSPLPATPASSAQHTYHHPTPFSSFQSLLASGFSPLDIAEALKTQTVEFVLTAHPTQATRRTLLMKYRAMAGLLARNDQAGKRCAAPHIPPHACALAPRILSLSFCEAVSVVRGRRSVQRGIIHALEELWPLNAHSSVRLV